MKYAVIVVSIGHEKLNHIFHYKIPDNIIDIIEIGMRVSVPFGKGNRNIEGYVVDFSDSADVADDKIKYISSVTEKYSVLSQKRIMLAKWMENKYYTTFSNCLSCIAPKYVKEKQFPCISLNNDNHNLEKEIEKVLSKNTKQKRVLEILLKGDIIPVSHIKTLLNVTTEPIRALEKKGIIKYTYYQQYRGNFNVDEVAVSNKPVLTPEQYNAVEKLYSAIDNNDLTPILIHGVTGSGKTEVYLRCIEKVLEQDKSAIVLVPEISLTQQTVERFVSRFGNKVAVTHSKLSDGERYDQWTRARRGEISVMIGPRSAVFTPFENLGIIVIDEEHETTYKADQHSPKFDAREVAIRLGELYNCQVVLGSATPSVTSYYKASTGEYRLIELKNRVNNTYPDIKIIDMRVELENNNRSIFSEPLKNAIEYNLENNQQTILFLNRRGFANFVSCRKCGYVMTCDNCNVNYTYHKDTNSLLCHYCGASQPKPVVCPQCGSEHIRQFGIGTEKIEEDVKKLFPQAKTLRMDLDTTKNKNAHNIIIDKFRNGEADILIGTQMIAKGLDFPNVTVVGAIAADMSLNVNDYHSAETTFQLVTQVAGRAGRAGKIGTAYIQTYNPDHYSLVCSAKNDYIKFYNEEIKFREKLKYPPFGNIFVVLFSGSNLADIRQYLSELSYLMTRYNKNNQFEHTGPMPAVISRIKNNHRWQIIVKAENEEKIKNYVLFCLNKLKSGRNLDKINIGLYLNPNYSF